MAKRKYVKENNLVKSINTDSLELKKPLANEYYDINVHNSNMDKIDLAIKQNKNNISENKASILSIKNLENEEVEVRKIETEENFIAVEDTKNGYFTDIKLEGKTLVVNENNEVVEAGTSGATIKSVGQDANEISVLSTNKEETKEDKKRILYYDSDTKAWEKPVLREWDSIEKHSDGKYYYHKRSGEVTLNGSETWVDSTMGNGLITRYIPLNDMKRERDYSNIILCDKFKVLSSNSIEQEGISAYSNLSDYVGQNWLYLNTKIGTDELKQWLKSNPVTVVYQLAEEKVYECTNLDLISYQDETNYIVDAGVITPKSSFNVSSDISNVVTLLQKNVNNVNYHEHDYQQYKLTNDNGNAIAKYKVDLNDLTKCGFYAADECINAPTAYISLIVLGNPTFSRQIACAVFSNEMWIRSKQAETWTSWKKVTSSDTYSLLEQQISELETQATENEKKISILEQNNQELREELNQIQTSIAALITTTIEK